MKKYLFLLLLVTTCQPLAWSQIAFFKSIKARSISIGSASYSGHYSSMTFEDFRNHSRFGSLFETPQDYEWNGRMFTSTLSIFMNFKMKDSTLFRHEFIAGIRKGTQRVNWLSSSENEANLNYKGRSEWMKFIIGYRYYMVKRKIIRLSAGPTWDLGFSISSSTKEKTDFRSYKYFGKPSMTSSISTPITGEIRIFKGAWVYLGPTFGIGYFTQDGNNQWLLTSGFNIGLRLDL